MANVKRKERRVREAFERAKIAEKLEQQVEELTKALEERNNTIHDLRNKIMGVQLQHDKAVEELETLRETLALAKKEHADELLRYQTAFTERGEFIDELERKRKLARAARDVAERKLAELIDKDRDSAKLRRRLHEAKETIKELQTEICRLKKTESEAF